MAVNYDRTSIKLRMLGHFGTSGTVSDSWSTGLRLAVVGGANVSTGDLTAFLESISGPVQTFHASSPAFNGTNCYLDELTAAHIGTNGKYVSSSELTTHRVYTTPVAGTGSPIHPWNTALVTSLRTLQARGLASNGRMYWPNTAIAVQTNTGRTGTLTSYVGAVKTMLDAINVAAQSYQSGLRIHVLGYSAKTGQNFTSLVTNIRADNRLDSIERRENQQAPIWATAALA